jgi:hypothetical protein
MSGKSEVKYDKVGKKGASGCPQTNEKGSGRQPFGTENGD